MVLCSVAVRSSSDVMNNIELSLYAASGQIPSLCKISAKCPQQFRRTCVQNSMNTQRDRQTNSKLNIPNIAREKLSSFIKPIACFVVYVRR